MRILFCVGLETPPSHSCGHGNSCGSNYFRVDACLCGYDHHGITPVATRSHSGDTVPEWLPACAGMTGWIGPENGKNFEALRAKEGKRVRG